MLGGLLLTQQPTLTDYWGPLASLLLPPAAVLLSTTVGWVAVRLRSTSAAVQSISSQLEECSKLLHQLHELNALVRDVPARRKSS